MNVKGHYEWLQRLTPLLVAIIIANVLTVFRGYWWNDTYNIIWLSLAIISLVHFLGIGRLPRFVLYTIEFISIVIVTIMIRKEHFVPIAEDVKNLTRLWHYIQSMHPFIEIVLVVSISLLLLSAWVTSKKRLYIFFAVSLLILCVKDSYSPMKLWLQIAIIIVVFLIWHTLLHFHYLQQKNSTSFKLLLHRPLAVIMPMFVVIAMLIVIGTNLPAKPPLLEDPYALWKQSRGEKVEIGNGLGTGGGGGLSSTNDSSPLNSMTSGYSRTDKKLGGSFQFDYSPVMTVKTTHKSYWRGESRYYYDGTGWYDTSYLSENEGLTEIIRVDEEFIAEERPLAQTVMVEQQYNFVRQAPLPVLFAAGQATRLLEVVYKDTVNLSEELTDITEITTIGPGELLKGALWHPSDWRIEQYGDGTVKSNIATYQVESEVIVIDHQALAEATATIEDEDAMEAYTSIPLLFPERVRKLAEEVTATANNDYEKVLLLEQHLKSSYNYTNTPDTTKLTGTSSDFVEQFLFELQEGYCDYFSTSMVMMARTLNIPARWVKGFSSGVSDEPIVNQEQLAYTQYMKNSDTSGTYTVRNADAHSWVEVYFEGYGWVAFEPTPGFAFPYTYVDDEINPLENVLVPTPAPLQSEDITPKQNKEANQSLGWIGYALLAVLVILAIMLGVKYRKELIELMNRIRYRKYSMNERVIVETTNFLSYCYRNGLVKVNNATLRETVSSWNFGSAAWRNDLQQLLHYYERAHYSGEVMNEKQLIEVQNLVKSLKKGFAKNKL
ncbi:transglutaminase-like domain-containing protein [Paenibacillus endoradicis]|uniref:transglutaminase-like domain-containing protein n=1 Tax=Paenibacillus endoradicis TaxID=2972487 RepID=UPI0021597ABE|nr:transglutaminase-like domain-containing protein [Paenibacillus endoradicis]MCR8655866.1 transglutaminase-like domain-containing protein [Paenibacillus endoradicis]MCR8658192.1 transglutaminase-like domain-containing protein [Paenibacillus endoradicis]